MVELDILLVGLGVLALKLALFSAALMVVTVVVFKIIRRRLWRR